jgi:DNA-binding LacI/PurR family transcriptional regulator
VSQTDPRRKPATIYDVARLANVSHQSVAVYLRGDRGFRPQTRERIEAALAELQYRPNLHARALASARSHRIGALVYAFGEAGPNRTIQGASERAREAGYVLDLVTLDPADPQAVQKALGSLGQQSIAGLLAFAPIDRIADQIDRIAGGVPVLAEAEVHDGELQQGQGINGPGLTLLVDHLAHLGHRRFFHLSGPLSWAAGRNRVLAYERALARHGLTSVGSLEGDWSAQSGYQAAGRMPLDAGITAVVTADDQMALGALLALAERGLSVPDDVSVTGFDDLPEARFYRPPLTTVRVDYALQGRRLVERMLDLIDEKEPVEPGTMFDVPQLVVRSSTGVPRPT